VTTEDGCNGHYHAFLWERGSIVDLQALIEPGSGINVDAANQINDKGEILGSGVLPNGERHAILLIPRNRD